MARKKKGTKKLAFSVADLIDKADAFLETADFESAARCYQRALALEPDNCEAMDALGELCLEMGDEDQARRLFIRSIELRPSENFTKYFYLGQLLSGHDSLRAFERGLALLEEEIKQVMSGAHEGDMAWLRQQKCSALCSMAEVFLTDSCDDEDAEVQCERYVQAALQVAPDLPEPHQLLASLRLSQQRPAEAADAIERSLSLWYRPELDADSEGASDGDRDGDDAGDDAGGGGGDSRLAATAAAAASAASAPSADMDTTAADAPPVPPYPFRVSTVKILLELDKADKAADIATALLAEDDEDVEVLYLAGLAASMLGDFDESRAFLDRATTLLPRVECAPEVRTQVATLLADVRNRLEARAAAAAGGTTGTSHVGGGGGGGDTDGMTS